MLQTMGLVLEDDNSNNNKNNETKRRYGVISIQWDEQRVDDEDQETRITFQSIDDLNAYMQSPVRQRFLRRLQPLLVAPSQVQVRHGRSNSRGDHNTTNALSDLCHTQTGCRTNERPLLPPKKWKVWFLTTLALYTMVLFVNESVPHYLAAWWGIRDLSSADYYQQRIAQGVRNVCSTVGNAYVATPFLTMIFRHWLVRQQRRHRYGNHHVKDKKNEIDDNNDDYHQPWIFLSNGTDSIVVKMIICVAFYGGTALAWYLRQQQA